MELNEASDQATNQAVVGYGASSILPAQGRGTPCGYREHIILPQPIPVLLAQPH